MDRLLLSDRFFRAAAPEIQQRLAESQRAKVKQFEVALDQLQLTLIEEGCPCGETDDIAVAEVDRYGLPLTTVLCKHCGTLRTNPYMDAASLEAFYRETYLALYGWAPVVEDYFARQASYGQRVLSLYERELPPAANILEIGCGAGGALSVFQEQGLRVAGCDLSRDLIEFGTSSGIGDLWHGTPNDVPRHLADRRFDLIYLHHVFEHMTSPRETLDVLSKLLTPTGRILVIVPDISRVDQFPIPSGDILQFLHVGHKFNFTTTCLDAVASQTALAAESRIGPTHIMTPWSQMPELWVEFRASSLGSISSAPVRLAGHRMLRRLLKIERQFVAGRPTLPIVHQANETTTKTSLQPSGIKKIWGQLRRKDAA